MNAQNQFEDKLDRIFSLIERETFLKLSVLDIQQYDDTLVVMSDDAVPRAFVRQILNKVWQGPVEVYCAASLMAGSTTTLV